MLFVCNSQLNREKLDEQQESIIDMENVCKRRKKEKRWNGKTKSKSLNFPLILDEMSWKWRWKLEELKNLLWRASAIQLFWNEFSTKFHFISMIIYIFFQYFVIEAAWKIDWFFIFSFPYSQRFPTSLKEKVEGEKEKEKVDSQQKKQKQRRKKEEEEEKTIN